MWRLMRKKAKKLANNKNLKFYPIKLKFRQFYLLMSRSFWQSYLIILGSGVGRVEEEILLILKIDNFHI